MDTTSLANFEKEVAQIRWYILHTQLVEDVVEYPISARDAYIPGLVQLKYHRSSDSGRKMFEYKAIIISLYGLLERYVEIWIKDYTDNISSLIPYNELDEKIRKSHFELSMKLVSMLMEDKWDKYDFLSKEEVLKNLHSCVENQSNYKLNTDAFTVQSGNLKHKRIVIIFDNLNIKLNDKLIKNENLNQEIGIASNKIGGTEKKVLYAKINDIVDRRNDIAHGAEVDNLLRSSELIPYVNFLEKYCRAVFEVLMQEYLRLESIHKFRQIEVVHKVLKHSIVAFQIEQYIINKGDVIIIETTEGRFYKTPILELQKDDEQYSTLEITDKTDIAVRIDVHINKNCKFYIERK